ncbi:MAG: excinuclease ABC subunit UvrB [Bacteroidales bacterium]|nr:excinuclease ABC subunit UvrB [Bacteroidales bacterium]MBO7568660.1 excinuclease ABC subunit UvrB [Bacteroidales bacterium]
MDFKIVSEFKPTGDQPEAIRQLTEGVRRGDKCQILKGVTGSGKTFTIANVIQNVGKPVLVLSHNKTLAAQLYGEFKSFFPENAVEYFVSYYDYYQPEAFIPSTNTYIEKDLSINDDIEKLRMSAATALLSGRRDIIVVSSVSCLYGIGNPEDFHANIVHFNRGENLGRTNLLRMLSESLYSRNEIDFKRGTFRVKGDTVDVFVAYDDYAYRIRFWDDEVDEIIKFDPETNMTIETCDFCIIYPAKNFITSQDRLNAAMQQIRIDLGLQIQFFKDEGKSLEAKRIEDRVNNDLEMLQELGHCQGVENYSRYFDGRKPGSRPFCLLDYFPDDFLMVIDESHVTLGQIHAMYGGDRSRKVNLVEYGFRLPAALDNRPLKFTEFEDLCQQVIYLSATPADYELEKCGGVVVEQMIRPTGLLDPPIDVRPTLNQIDDLMNEIQEVVKRDERVMVTTLTKRMAEELTKYLLRMDIRAKYIHSDVDTLERIEIMDGLRAGTFDVLVGVNLLREGLDVPEVSLVAILDADKEGFLRSARSLTQTAGRAARNVHGRVIMYADVMTDSMRDTIDETNRHRSIQMQYNDEHGITPTQIRKQSAGILIQRGDTENVFKDNPSAASMPKAAEHETKFLSKRDLERMVRETRQEMERAAKKLDFVTAASLRDKMFEYQKALEERE